MKVTLGDKFRLQLEALKMATVSPPPAPVVVPTPMEVALAEADTVADEAQVVGELLEWLEQHRYLKADAPPIKQLQKSFFSDPNKG
jgi:hypothetical protein